MKATHTRTAAGSKTARSAEKGGRQAAAGARKRSAVKKAVGSARINFIPNDPVALASVPMRVVEPRPDRPAAAAGFAFPPPPAPAAKYAPGTQEFLYWQCREAALLAVETYETVGGPLGAWAPGVSQRLPVLPDDGVQLNAFYDRVSLSFFEHTSGGVTTFSGASTDVVAHEVGHAILDALRPSLILSDIPEHNAFHEAFGDCIALLTALADQRTRTSLLATSPTLETANFVEATMEDLSAGIRRALGPSHPSSEPRHAFNTFRWQLPTTLPTIGPPELLTGEEHSFARVFTGCFYDTIRGIFAAQPKKTPTTLWTATRVAGGLLVDAARAAVEQTRFFQAVGQAMVRADMTANSGTNREAIKAAFLRHGIALGAGASMQPSSWLAGAVPAATRATAIPGVRAATSVARVLSPKVIADEVRRRIAAPSGARLERHALTIAGESVEKFVHRRHISLEGLSEHLAGVVGRAPEPMVVGGIARGVAAVLGQSPEASASEDEVRYFVATLLDRNSIAFEGEARPRRGVHAAHAGAVAASAGRGTGDAGATEGTPVTPVTDTVTHVVRTVGGTKMLTRVRYACGCHRAARHHHLLTPGAP
ncbi:MAG: hypothetical protein WKG32_13865 [Gemmatimonadaceae bacterium]